MNYELAKKLKDAGFPQEYEKSLPYNDMAYKIDEQELHLIHEDNDTNWRIGNDYAHSEMTDEQMQKEWIKVPTLSELIEACGRGFNSLERYSNGERWRCVKWVTHFFECTDGKTRKGCLWEGDSWGFTPEEAVANLWLALNKK